MRGAARPLRQGALSDRGLPQGTRRVDHGSWYATTGVGPDLYENAQNAARGMLDHLTANHGLSREDAYLLLSLAVDLKISEIVDAGQYIVSALLPQAVFKA